MSDPDHTAARLVIAAERLFAAGGEEATSLRAVTREARSNAAAVHYHFGGRDELLRAVLDRQLSPVDERRQRLLDRAALAAGSDSAGSDSAGSDSAVAVDAVLDAVVRPDLELLSLLRRDEVHVARFLGRAQTSPGAAVAEWTERRFGALADRVLPLLRASLPGVEPAELRHRLRLVNAAVLMLFATATATATIEAAGKANAGVLGTDDVDEQVRRLVAFCAGGMSAPGATKPKPRSRAKSHAKNSAPAGAAETTAAATTKPSSGTTKKRKKQ